MRKIKFRAWDAEEKEWLCIKHLGIMNNGIWYVQAIDENENDIDPPYFEDDKNLKLMQYTGLTDTNGVEIYEGDICKLGYATAVVEYQVSRFVLKQNTTELHPNILAFEAYKNTVSEEVIGNIYENPELLEGAE